MKAIKTWLSAAIVSCPLAGLPLVAASAEDTLGLGTRVRVSHFTVYGPQRVSGEVVSLDGDSLRIRCSETETRWVSWRYMNGLERSAGTRTHGQTGALIGGGIGWIPGMAVLVSRGPSEYSESFFRAPMDVNDDVLIGVAGLGIGALLGLAIGSLIRTDDWQPLPADSYPPVD